jgi:hypothetical protein
MKRLPLASIPASLCFSVHAGQCTSQFSGRLLSFAKSTVSFVVLPNAVTGALSHAILIENHSDIFPFWVQAGIRAAVVVNVDAHDDCLPMSQRRAEKLRRLVDAGDIAAIDCAISGSDAGLYYIKKCQITVARKNKRAIRGASL